MTKQFAMKVLLASSVTVTGLLGAFAAAPVQVHAATEQSLALIDYGKEYTGTPYKYGVQAGSTSAFDCSSYVQYVFKQFEIQLPRTSSAQAKLGEKVDKGYLSVGDLVFFNTSGKGISHVAIYAGNGKILHASTSKGVTLSDMNSKYWSNAYVTARRVL